MISDPRGKYWKVEFSLVKERCIFKVDRSERVIIICKMRRVLVSVYLRPRPPLYERSFNAVATSPAAPPKTITGRRRRPKSPNTDSQNRTVFLKLVNNDEVKKKKPPGQHHLISQFMELGTWVRGKFKYGTLRRGEHDCSASRTRPRLGLPSSGGGQVRRLAAPTGIRSWLGRDPSRRGKRRPLRARRASWACPQREPWTPSR